jgi:DNA helicase HerA-like ATPase
VDTSSLRQSEASATRTPVGQVLAVRGSEAQVGLPAPWPDGDSRATVGKYLSIEAGPRQVIGMITEVTARRPDSPQVTEYRAVARIDLMGEIARDATGKLSFRRGVAEYPAIGDAVALLDAAGLRLIYAQSGIRTVEVGTLEHEGGAITARLDVDNLISKHFAILGSTGVGKSSGLTVILSEIMRVRPDLRVFLLDGHNEYAHSFGNKANVIGPRNLKLPFWLFNFDEFTDVIYGGRPGVPEEIEILAELIPIAKTAYLQYKTANDRFGLKKSDPKRSGYTVDTPVPYLLQDLLSLIDDRMGKLENRSSRMNYHRLILRIETIKSDPRYAFMFENASVGGDTMAGLLSHLFRLEPDGRPISIVQLSGLPVEVVDAVVCVLGRLAFDFGLWSDGAMPLLFVCEEAHRYAAADHSIGFAPTRRALSRIAKEGRKYGVFLGLATQRPAELDPTIISQCSTLFAMRMANDHDQALLRSAVSDAAAHLLDFVPSLATGEVVGFGEGMPIPTRFTFKALDPALVPRSESARLETLDDGLETADFVRAVVERWRGATTSQRSDEQGTAPVAAPVREERPAAPIAATRPEPAATGMSEVSRLLDQARAQLLKR